MWRPRSPLTYVYAGVLTGIALLLLLVVASRGWLMPPAGGFRVHVRSSTADSIVWLQATPSPTSLPTPIPTSRPTDADEERLLRVMRAFHEAGNCTRDTSLYVTGTGHSGFGNMFMWWFLDWLRLLHIYAQTGERHVHVIGEQDGWWGGVSIDRDVWRPSVCQAAYRADASGLPRRAGNVDLPYGFAMTRLPGFENRSVRWVLRKALAYVLQFSVTESEMRALGAPVTLASNASRVSFEDVHLDVPRPLVAIHIRRGDACTTKGVNYGRPPCQNLETYLADLAEVERRYAADEPSARVQSIFVATDSADVISEIRALNDSRMWWLSGVDRAKYAPEGSQKIENFMASAKRVDALRDFWTEVTVMAQADAVIGQCYSTMFDMAVFGGRHKGYRCTDEGYPCARGGCPTPLSGAHDRCSWMESAFTMPKVPETYDPLYAALYADYQKNREMCFQTRRIPNYPSHCVGRELRENPLCL